MMASKRRTAIVDAEAELATRLRLGVTRLARRLRQQSVEGDVTASMLSALATIEVRGSLTLGELAELERIRPPSMTRIVSRLEALGVVTRKADSHDRRVFKVTLTPAGSRYVSSARKRKNAYLVKRLHALEPDELRKLDDALEVIEKLVEGDR
ncbi:MAG: MarR family winged helix-turn-helix transcriptional regulator [Actinomycetota bacterium]